MADKSKKAGRFSRSPSNIRYNMENRRLVNKVKRLKRHLKKFPEDQQAQTSLEHWGHARTRVNELSNARIRNTKHMPRKGKVKEKKEEKAA